jgi:hypothetical protein
MAPTPQWRLPAGAETLAAAFLQSSAEAKFPTAATAIPPVVLVATTNNFVVSFVAAGSSATAGPLNTITLSIVRMSTNFIGFLLKDCAQELGRLAAFCLAKVIGNRDISAPLGSPGRSSWRRERRSICYLN